MSLLSIILPVYNVELYLAECLDTILNQTFTDFEVLLINDGSPDNSGAICDEYALKDSRIRVFHQENAGVSAARNLGIENAQGMFVTFIDPDDHLTSNTVYEKVFSGISDDVDIVHFGFERKNIQGNYIPPLTGKYTAEEIRNKLFPIFVGNKIDHFRKIFVMSAVFTLVIRRSLIIDNNIRFQPIKRTEDKLFFFESFLAAKIFYVLPNTFYFYRVNPTSATQNYNPDFLSEMEFSQNYQKKLLIENHLLDSVAEEFENSVLYQFYYGIMNEIKGGELNDGLCKILSYEKSQNIRQLLTWSKTLKLMKENPFWMLIKLRQYRSLMRVYPYYLKLK